MTEVRGCVGKHNLLLWSVVESLNHSQLILLSLEVDIVVSVIKIGFPVFLVLKFYT